MIMYKELQCTNERGNADFWERVYVTIGSENSENKSNLIVWSLSEHEWWPDAYCWRTMKSDLEIIWLRTVARFLFIISHLCALIILVSFLLGVGSLRLIWIWTLFLAFDFLAEFKKKWRQNEDNLEMRFMNF